jgi:hypothetical protein
MLKSPALPAALAVGALFQRQQSYQDLPMRSVLDGGITLAPFESSREFDPMAATQGTRRSRWIG